jgi:hypothetical protein
VKKCLGSHHAACAKQNFPFSPQSSRQAWARRVLSRAQRNDRPSGVYFQFHHTINEPGEDLEDFSARLKSFLDERRPDNLIIDVRHNNGGDSQVFPPAHELHGQSVIASLTN